MEIKGAEIDYLKGPVPPLAGSVLISNSPYLNNPRFRDVYAQMGLKRDAADLPSTFLIPEINRAIAEEMDFDEIDALIAAERAQKPEFAAWLDRRHVSDWNNTDLSGCAPGTLGTLIRNFISDSGMQIDFMFRDAPQSDFDYISKRRAQNHDIEHMITGFDADPVGEIALIVANTVACCNYFSPALVKHLSLQPMFLASTSLMRASCHYPSVIPAMLEAFARGHAMGNKQTLPIFMIDWEEWIHTPVAELREHFGFDDGPEPGYWTWTHEANSG